MPADGVEMKLSGEAGALRVDFRFVKGGGYAVLHRALDLDLPPIYRLDFRVRGECPAENLELKLLDSTGANVWWRNQRDFVFPRDWQGVRTKKRQISFAWGPAGGGDLAHAAAIEFAITAGQGGSGTVWLDDLTLTPLPPPGATPPPVVATASSARSGQPARCAVDGDSVSWWESRTRDRHPWLELDLGTEREFGGLIVDWLPGRQARDYDVETSLDGVTWTTARVVRDGNGGRDALLLPESEARLIRIRVLRGAAPSVAIRDVRLMPLEWGATPETFYRALAAGAPRGTYPRGITGEQSFWTVVGVDGDRREALLGEDGAVETGRAAFSVEPFLFHGGALTTWADATVDRWLEDGELPIPTVRWRAADSLQLTVTAFGAGAPGASSVVARYRVRNAGARPARGTLFLALRPFQVNPPAQFLGTPGGVARIEDLRQEGRRVLANGDRGVVSLTAPDGFGAATFDEGDVVGDFLRAGRLPPRTAVEDGFAHASGAFAYGFDLAPGAEREVDVEIPLYALPAAVADLSDDEVRAGVVAREDSARATWRERVGRVTIEVPPSAHEDAARATWREHLKGGVTLVVPPPADVVRALEAQLGWILVNRDSAGIQPGSRSYARSWIRDGSLTSSALLRLGQADVVRDFIEWFAPHLYADGKVPCCVDARGSDPVPENDANGEFIYLVAEYVRYTGDRSLLERMWPAVARAAAYLDSLRQERRSPDWRAPGKEEYFGLLPPSISHEGYSAKPMHSYWDDLFALRGFEDAAWLAGELGLEADRVRLEASRDEFRHDLVASIETAMRVHGIDYLPGCADLGDFDATSTTIALNPVQADDVLSHAALQRTFERYWDFFRDRRDGRKPWEAFTPYEMRTIGAFVRLGWRERALELLDFFLRFRRPSGWNQWAEVAWHDEKTPHFIGDLPHTWVGSDYVRSVLDMFAYERESDSALVIGAGLSTAWLADSGVTVRGLRTRWGPLTYSVRGYQDEMRLTVEASGLRVPPGGIVVAVPVTVIGDSRELGIEFSEDPAGVTRCCPLTIRTLPATIRWSTYSLFRPLYR
jgi:hypothetical protein